MGRASRTTVGLLLAAVLALFVATASASATFHIMQVRSIDRGPTGSPASAFVELQMWGDFQNLVGGHTVRIYSADGTTSTPYTLPGNVPNGQIERRILIGDTGAPASPDFTFPGIGTNLAALAGGGALCWETIDCVSWGSFSGDALLPSSAGTPIAGGLSPLMPSVRNITPGCPTALDAADDTNQSNADFSSMAGYTPRNNSLTPTEVVCAPPSAAHKKRKCKRAKKKPGNNGIAYAAKKKCKHRK
jgi:hypothetical protein